MNNKYYSNKRVYTRDKRRVAVFAREIDNNHVEIFELFTHKNDQFSRFLAEEVYKSYINNTSEAGIYEDGRIYLKYKGVEYHPEINIFEKPNKKDTVQYALDVFCKENYFKKGKTTIEVDALYKYNELIVLN